ncbi:hypothetical protein QE152_g9028 [Popillia japonica]|uniref:Uncharacterized protein n=1 Tax=Popillia japonica TaxID=7064 RepID=A0AAW1M103_POPJA
MNKKDGTMAIQRSKWRKKHKEEPTRSKLARKRSIKNQQIKVMHNETQKKDKKYKKNSKGENKTTMKLGKKLEKNERRTKRTPKSKTTKMIGGKGWGWRKRNKKELQTED